MAKTKVIIGGGAGLCGSWLSRHLINKGYDVVILDDFSESYPENLDPRAKFYLVDISDLKKVQQIFDIERPDYVYGMMAHASECLSPWTRIDCYKSCLLTELSLINTSINTNVKKIIGFSSMAIYGNQQAPFVESMSPDAIDTYGEAKATLEKEHELAKNHQGLNYSIVRPHNFQGIYVNWASIYRNFLAIAARRAISGQNIQVYGAGDQTRAFGNVE